MTIEESLTQFTSLYNDFKSNPDKLQENRPELLETLNQVLNVHLQLPHHFLTQKDRVPISIGDFISALVFFTQCKDILVVQIVFLITSQLALYTEFSKPLMKTKAPQISSTSILTNWNQNLMIDVVSSCLTKPTTSLETILLERKSSKEHKRLQKLSRFHDEFLHTTILPYTPLIKQVLRTHDFTGYNSLFRPAASLYHRAAQLSNVSPTVRAFTQESGIQSLMGRQLQDSPLYDDRQFAFWIVCDCWELTYGTRRSFFTKLWTGTTLDEGVEDLAIATIIPRTKKTLHIFAMDILILAGGNCPLV